MSFRALRRLLVSSNSSFVALDARHADTLAFIGSAIARGERVADDALAAACGSDYSEAREHASKLAAPMLVPVGKGQRIAIVNFRGLVTYDLEFQPFAVSMRLFTEHMRALTADETVKSIVLYMDSPGGSVVGLPEAADAVYEARKAKKVTAVVDVLCASAAYYVASQASEIVALPSGEGVGSIGVRMMHVDCSGALDASGIAITHIYSGDYKVEGNPHEPLSEDARARFQEECDTLYLGFLAAVSRGRGASIETVRDTFGKGRVLSPFEARRVGMIDKLDEPLSALCKLGLVAVSAGSEALSFTASEVSDEVAPLPVATNSVEAVEPQDEIVNQELTSSSQVDVAAVADLEARRALLDLMSY